MQSSSLLGHVAVYYGRRIVVYMRCRLVKVAREGDRELGLTALSTVSIIA